MGAYKYKERLTTGLFTYELSFVSVTSFVVGSSTGLISVWVQNLVTLNFTKIQELRALFGDVYSVSGHKNVNNSIMISGGADGLLSIWVYNSDLSSYSLKQAFLFPTAIS